MMESAQILVERVEQLFKERAPALLNVMEEFAKTWDKLHQYCLLKIAVDDPELQELFDEEGSYQPLEIEGAIRKTCNELYVQLLGQIWKTARESVTSALEKALRDRFVDALGVPPPVTLVEMKELATRHLLDDTDVDEGSVETMERSVVRRLRRLRWKNRILIATAEHPFETDGSEPPIWSNDWSEIRLRATPAIRVAHVHDFELPQQYSFVKVYASFAGWVSDKAVQSNARKTRKVVRAALWALSDIASPGNLKSRIGRLPSIDRPTLDQNREFLCAFVTSFFSPRRIKGTALAQQRNCVQLLVEADRQDHDAIALSLYCSALEALLSRGKEGVTKSLAEDVATLLEPVPTARLEAIKVVRELYNLRSRALHGDSLDESAIDRARARAVATHTLRALFELFKSEASPSDPNEKQTWLLRELERARVTGGTIESAPVSRVRVLWGQRD